MQCELAGKYWVSFSLSCTAHGAANAWTLSAVIALERSSASFSGALEQLHTYPGLTSLLDSRVADLGKRD